MINIKKVKFNINKNMNIKLNLYYNKMTDVNFLSDFINKVDKIRADEFKTNDFEYEEIIIEKKLLNENLQEYKKFQHEIKKKVSLEKNKPKNFGKKEVDVSTMNIDILKDDIFNSNNLAENKEDEIKLDVVNLDRDKKLELINEFLQRKNINLDEVEYNKIYNIIDDENIIIKKYFNVSKMYQQITKISFIKKLENGSYIIDLNENKPRKSKKLFLNK